MKIQQKILKIITVVLLTTLNGCEPSSFYGSYALNKIIYLSLSATSIEQETNIMKDREFIIGRDVFSIEEKIYVEKPIYCKEKFNNTIFESKTDFWLTENFTWQYQILDQDNNEIYYIMYLGKESIYLVNYDYNDKQEIVINIVYVLK